MKEQSTLEGLLILVNERNLRLQIPLFSTLFYFFVIIISHQSNYENQFFLTLVKEL